MKNKFIFFVIFLFVLIVPSSYGVCKGNVEVYLEVISLTDKETISEYQFPEFREGDLLAINNVSVYNVGACNVTNPDIKLELINEKYNISFLGWSANFYTTIQPNEQYSIFRDNSSYFDSRGNERDYSPEPLNVIGQWQISISSKNTDIRSFTLNGIKDKETRLALYGDFILFRVFTTTDLELRELSKSAILIAVASILLSLLLFVSEHFVIKPCRRRKNQENLLINLLTHLSQVAKTSESYKEVFILTIRNNQFHFVKIVGMNELFKGFRNYLNLIIKDNDLSKIQDILKKDNSISIKIENICKLAINKLEKEFDKGKKPVRAILPFFKIRQIDGNFYSLNLNRSIGKEETIKLKNLLINLTEVIEVINYQINFVNNKTYLVRKDSQGLYEWYNFYYKAFMNLHDLDEKLSKVLKELLEFKALKKYFNQELAKIGKIIKINKEIKEETLKNIEMLNRIYQRFKICQSPSNKNI